MNLNTATSTPVASTPTSDAYDTAMERLIDALTDDTLMAELRLGKEVEIDGAVVRIVAHVVVP